MSMGLWHWWTQGDAVTQATAAVLLLMSVISWVVIVYKLWFLARSKRQTPRAIAAFWSANELQNARSAVQSLDSGLSLPLVDAVAPSRLNHQGDSASLASQAQPEQRLTRQLRAALESATGQLYWGQTLLATIGATAPFVGLLGTVWGIHHALAILAGSNQIGIEQLAGPVGEALVMTAAGLAVALPAVLAYNLLGRSASALEALLEGFAHDLQAQFGAAKP